MIVNLTFAALAVALMIWGTPPLGLLAGMVFESDNLMMETGCQQLRAGHPGGKVSAIS